MLKKKKQFLKRKGKKLFHRRINPLKKQVGFPTHVKGTLAIAPALWTTFQWTGFGSIPAGNVPANYNMNIILYPYQPGNLSATRPPSGILTQATAGLTASATAFEQYMGFPGSQQGLYGNCVPYKTWIQIECASNNTGDNGIMATNIQQGNLDSFTAASLTGTQTIADGVYGRSRTVEAQERSVITYVIDHPKFWGIQKKDYLNDASDFYGTYQQPASKYIRLVVAYSTHTQAAAIVAPISFRFRMFQRVKMAFPLGSGLSA